MPYRTSFSSRTLVKRLMTVSAAMLAVSVGAKFVAGYVVRGWRRLQKKQDLSFDVVAPKYGPALVVSTEEFENSFKGIVSDGLHTQTFLRLTRLEMVRKASVLLSLIGVLTATALWLMTPDRREK